MRLKQIGLAMHNYHDAMGGMPTGVVGPNGYLGLSWRVAILPYLERDDVANFRQFNLKEPWNSEHNKRLIAKMPKVFESPGKKAPEGKTHLRSYFGDYAFLRLPFPRVAAKGKEPPGPFARLVPGTLAPGISLPRIPDGSSNTIAVFEATEPVEWTRPDDLPFPGFPGMPKQPPVPKLGGPFAGGFHALMCDGSTHFFPDTLPETVLRALITADGGEVLGKEATDILMPPKPKAASHTPSVPAQLPDSAARRTAVENYSAIVRALHDFNDVFQYLPAGIVSDNAVGLSWRVQLLPYVGEDKLFKEFKLGEPWDGAHNKALLERMPKVFASPGKAAPKGYTFVRTTQGQGGIIPWDLGNNKAPQGIPKGWAPGMPLMSRNLLAGIPDGTSNTILFFEAAEAVPWTKPEEIPFTIPAPVIGKSGRSELPKDVKVPAMGGVFDGGFHAAMADGRITFYKSDYPSGELAKLLCPTDGWVVDPYGPPDKIGYSIPLEPTYAPLPKAGGKAPKILPYEKKPPE